MHRTRLLLVVFAIIPVNSALGEDPFVVEWIKNGQSTKVYQGLSNAMVMFQWDDSGGLLTAFAMRKGDPRKHCVQYSPDGKDLGNPGTRKHSTQERSMIYEGKSSVWAMAVRDKNVYTAFSDAPKEYHFRIHEDERRSDLKLGVGPVKYEGKDRVWHIVPFKDRLLTVLQTPDRKRFRVYWELAGKQLNEGDLVFNDSQGISAMTVFNDRVYTAFRNRKGQYELCSTDDPADLKQATHYRGDKQISAMSVHGKKLVCSLISKEAGDSICSVRVTDGKNILVGNEIYRRRNLVYHLGSYGGGVLVSYRIRG